MLEAEIHGKLPSIENMEDILTSNVFSIINYLDNNTLLLDILRKAKTINGKSFLDCQTINITEFSPEIQFWRNLGEYGQPDIIIRFKSTSQNDLFLGIEVKYYSSKSGEGDNDQLMRYFKGIKQLSSLRKSDFLGIIYLTKYSSTNEIKDTLSVLKNINELDFKDKIFQLRWHEITSVIEKYVMKKQNEKMINDLYRYLIFKNLVSFKNFTFLKKNFDLVYQNIYKIDRKRSNFNGFTFHKINFKLKSNEGIFYERKPRKL